MDDEGLTDRRGSLVEDEQLAPPQDGPSERKDLPLAYRQVRTSSRNVAVQRYAPRVRIALKAEQSGGTEGVVEH